MRYFYDCEFIEDGKTIDLISIGMVADDGRLFYAQNLDCEFSKANEWVRANVFPRLSNFDLETLKPIIHAEQEEGYGDWFSVGSIVQILAHQLPGNSGFVVQGAEPVEFWGYYSAYDHVALCQLFGTMMELPKGWPMLTYDLRQWLDGHGLHHYKQPDDMPHHALSDAKWIAETVNRFMPIHYSKEIVIPPRGSAIAGGQDFWRQNEE